MDRRVDGFIRDRLVLFRVVLQLATTAAGHSPSKNQGFYYSLDFLLPYRARAVYVVHAKLAKPAGGGPHKDNKLWHATTAHL